jgi:O-antigen/teichoic acid export membrane protein
VPEKHKPVLSSISYFSVSRYGAEFLFFVRGFLLAKILGPENFGLWSMLKTSMMFMQYIRLGANEAMLREFPFAVGRGEQNYAQGMEAVVGGFNLLSAVILSLLIMAGFLLFKSVDAERNQCIWAAFLVIFLINQIYWFIHLRFQAKRKFIALSKMTFGFALFSTLLGVSMAYCFGIYGLLAGLALSYIAMILSSGEGKSPLPKPAWDTLLVWKLIKIGFPIMLSQAFYILLLNVDKLIIWISMQKEDLGIYSIQSYIVNIIILFPTVVSMVLYPNLMENLGKNQHVNNLQDYLTKPTQIMAYVGAPLLGVLFIVIHLPIQWLLPQYVSAVVPTQILISSSFFLVISRMPAVILISVNRQKLLMAMTLPAILCGISVDWALIAAGKGIAGVAVGTSISFILYAILTMIASLRCTKMTLKNSIAFALKLFTPYAIVGTLLALTLFLIPTVQDRWLSDLTNTGLKSVVLILLIGFSYYLISQKFGSADRQGIFDINAHSNLH